MKPCSINTKLLPLKSHYFFTYAGFGAVSPFLPIIAKQLGLSATVLGIGFSLIPIFMFLCNPIIGLLVDFFQTIKVFLVFLLISSSVACAFILCLPPITYEHSDAIYIRISHFDESKALLNISKPFGRSCLGKIIQNHTECKLTFEDEKENNSVAITLSNTTYNINQNQAKESNHWVTFYTKDTSLFDRKDIISSLNVRFSPPIHQCSINYESRDLLYKYQFWVFFTLFVFVSIANSSACSITNVACLELLGTNTEAFGRQRLFGTIGYGIVCPLSGIINDYFGGSFVSVSYLLAIFRTINIIILCIISLPKAHVSSNMSRDLRSIFTSKEIIVASFGIAIIGFLIGIIVVNEFWFLEDMGANRTLLGLAVLMQCIVGEVPFLFFSEWFVNKLGHFLCFTCVLFGFVVRLLFYSFLKNPWLVLPLDTLHGLTTGLFHGTMASFAKEKAPKGMEATLLGFFGGLYEGLGFGLGSFVGGFALDRIGPRQTFFSASMLSIGCFMLFLLADYVFRKPPTFEPVSLEIEEPPNNL